MAYLYETHLHTSTSSACGRSKGSDYIAYYKSLGYDGIFVTDHFYMGNTCVDRKLPWDEWVKAYCEAYREAKAEGDRQGLKVFFGWETTYEGDDFLVYGLDEEWLLNHPEVREWDQKAQYEAVKAAGGLVVQAHPFRERFYMPAINLHPHQCDAWEVANAGNTHDTNIPAYEYAKKHHMTMTCGSDIHAVGDAGDGPFAMVFDQPLNSEADYVRAILSGEGFHIGVEESYFDYPTHEYILDTFMYDEENVGTQVAEGNHQYPEEYLKMMELIKKYKEEKK